MAKLWVQRCSTQVVRNNSALTGHWDDQAAMTRRYAMALKQQMVARLIAVNAPSAAQLDRETGISQQNLSRWLCEARNRPFGVQDSDITSAWTVEQKARIIVQSAGLTGDGLTGYLKRIGVGLGKFRRWRRALEEAGEASLGMTRRIARLERELIRKERALAEAATLLVLREAIEKAVEGIDKQVEEEEELNSSTRTGAAVVDNSTPSSPSLTPCGVTAPFYRGPPDCKHVGS